jgi:predicted regulator of amino acid metabolism with ACT domain
MNPMFREERTQNMVVKFLPVIGLKRENREAMLSGDVRVKRKKVGKNFILVTQRKRPCIVCKIIKNGKVVLIARVAQNRRSLDISMQ